MTTLAPTATLLSLAREAVISARGSLDHPAGAEAVRAAVSKCHAAKCRPGLDYDLKCEIRRLCGLLGALLALLDNRTDPHCFSCRIGELKKEARDTTWIAEAELRRLEGGLP